MDSKTTPETERFIRVPCILTKSELARWLHCSTRHIDELRSSANLPFFKLGGLIRFDALKISAWLEGRTYQKGGV